MAGGRCLAQVSHPDFASLGINPTKSLDDAGCENHQRLGDNL
jgi:hypothetical protein